MRFIHLIAATPFAMAVASPVFAQETASDLAKQLSNPVASLVSIPFQFNADFGYGPNEDGINYYLKIQPVIPMSISENWNLISRTIVPLYYQHDIFADDFGGLGDTLQSFFLSPKQPGPGGIIWGVGPVLNLPTETDTRLGSSKWGAGPTAVALVQKGPWTVGALVNHVWSLGGSDQPGDTNQTFLQPFVAYAYGQGNTITLNTESVYDWIAQQWLVPVNLMYSKVFKLGAQPVSFQLGGRYYAVTPENGPKWGVRSTFTVLLPTGR